MTEVPKHLHTFEKLRRRVHTQQEKQINKRLKAGRGRPTPLELALDAFKEELEPQVRRAIITMNRKGYETASSGFYGFYGEMQVIEGAFEVDPETVYKLYRMGVHVGSCPDPFITGVTQIFFYPPRANLKEMKKRWKTVANMLPSRRSTTL